LRQPDENQRIATLVACPDGGACDDLNTSGVIGKQIWQWGHYGWWYWDFEATGDTTYTFLTVLEAVDIAASQTTATYLASLDAGRVGVVIGDSDQHIIATFATDEADDSSVTYTAQSFHRPYLHNLADMEPGLYRARELTTGWQAYAMATHAGKLVHFESPTGGTFNVERVLDHTEPLALWGGH
jgi:hypothetical protein